MDGLSPAKRVARETVHGLWIAIPTPFTPDGRRVDEALLEASVEHYVDALQVDGIFCGGVMGESPTSHRRCPTTSSGSTTRAWARRPTCRCSSSTRPTRGRPCPSS